MAKPRPTEALFPDNPQLTRVVQDIYDRLTDDTLYDDTDVLADVEDLQDNKLQSQTYTEKWEDITHAVDVTWEEVDLSGYGVEAGDVCEIYFHNNSSDDNDAGVRTKDSSVDRRQVSGGGLEDRSQAMMNVVAGTAAVIELYLEDASDFVVHLAGYWRFSTS